MSAYDWEWLDDSACRDMDPDLFFIAKVGKRDALTQREIIIERAIARYHRDTAKKACAECPVREHCFWDAMEHPDPFAMRAGLTPRQLAKMRRNHLKEIEAREALLSRVA